MPFFECKVSRTIVTDDLKMNRRRETVYVEAKDEAEARSKAQHPANWLKSTGVVRNDKSSFLLTVDECRRLANDEVKALRPMGPAAASTLFPQSPFWGSHDDRSRV
jgi:hypothetical protein